MEIFVQFCDKSIFLLVGIFSLASPWGVQCIAEFEGLKLYCHNIYYQPGDIKLGHVENVHSGEPGSSDDPCLDTG